MTRNKIITRLIALLILIAAIIYFNKDSNNVDTDVVPSRNDTTLVEEATTTEPVVKSYSILEVALHDKPTDCWIVIEGKVINPTEFIAAGLHPNDKILNGCGKDMTEIFKNIPKHAGPKPQDALIKYEIGIVK